MTVEQGEICPHCGKEMRPGQTLWCNYCWKDLPALPEGFTPKSRYPALEAILQGESDGWSAAAVVRYYKDDEAGRGAFMRDVEILSLYGYVPSSQSVDGGHVHAGRLILTGGLSVFAGKSGIRSDGRLAVTFVRAAAPEPATTPPGATKVCPDCAETVQAAARICRFCRYEFGGSEAAPMTEAERLRIAAAMTGAASPPEPEESVVGETEE